MTVAVNLHGVADVEVYDTAEPARRLAFTAGEWSAFLAGVRAGEFDLDGRFARLREREAAGEAETHTEYRVYVESPSGNVFDDRFENEPAAQGQVDDWHGRGWIGARVESREVTTTRTTTPWEEQR